MVEFVEEHFGSVLARLKELPENHIEFNSLWTLFPRHCIVYCSDQLGQGRVCRVRGSSYEKTQDGAPVYVLSVDYLDSNGKHLGYTLSRALTPVDYFSGSKLIFDLPFYPLSLEPGYPNLRVKLISRGNKVLRLKGRNLQEYTGHALAENKSENKFFKFNVSHYLQWMLLVLSAFFETTHR